MQNTLTSQKRRREDDEEKPRKKLRDDEDYVPSQHQPQYVDTYELELQPGAGKQDAPTAHVRPPDIGTSAGFIDRYDSLSPDSKELIDHLPHKHTEHAQTILQSKPPAVPTESVQVADNRVADYLAALNWNDHAVDEDEEGNTVPHKIPGIPEDYIADFSSEPVAYTPNDIWRIRHLQVEDRHRMFLEFQGLTDTATDVEFSDQKFWDMWKLLKAKTKELFDNEKAWYRVYKDREYCEEDKKKWKKGVPLAWEKVLKSQAKLILINSVGSYARVSDSADGQPKPGTKRSAQSLCDGHEQPAPKKLRPNDSEAKLVNVREKQVESSCLSNLLLETKVPDQLDSHKQGKAIHEPPKYKAEHSWTRTGATSKKYDWMAAEYDRKPEKQEQKKLTPVRRKNEFGLSPLTAAENDNLPEWERCWDRDLVPLPEYPNTNVEDYSERADGSWRCFHEPYKCVDGACRHKCCKEGYTETQLNAAIRKKHATWKGQIEVLIDKELLDPRHRTWDTHKNYRLRKLQIHEEKEKEKAEMAKRDEERKVKEKKDKQEKAKAAYEQSPEGLAAAAALAEKQAAERERTIKNNLKKVDQWHEDACVREGRKNYPDWELLDAWWAAARKDYSLQPLTPEEKALRDLPEPSLTEKKPMLMGISVATSASQEAPIEELLQGDDDNDSLFGDPLEGVGRFDLLFDESPAGNVDHGDDPH